MCYIKLQFLWCCSEGVAVWIRYVWPKINLAFFSFWVVELSGTMEIPVGPSVFLYYTQLENSSVTASQAIETKCDASSIGATVDAQQCSVSLQASPSSPWQPILSHADSVTPFILLLLLLWRFDMFSGDQYWLQVALWLYLHTQFIRLCRGSNSESCACQASALTSHSCKSVGPTVLFSYPNCSNV